jgi:integrase/recombinase XerD
MQKISLINKKTPNYTGTLSDIIFEFIEQKQILGFKYNTESSYLMDIAKCSEKWFSPTNVLPREFVVAWCKKREVECSKTWSNRIVVIRQLAKYMNAKGFNAYETPIVIRKKQSTFTPHIYTKEELSHIFNALNLLNSPTQSPNRAATGALLFRILYGCGLRVSEALHLTLGDIDFETGVLTIWGSKFGVNRLVPMSEELTQKCRDYREQVHSGKTDNHRIFFMSPAGSFYSLQAIRMMLHEAFFKAEIALTDTGPRIHDFRHTFAVHCLQNWVKTGKNLTSALPVLAVYLGHKGLESTQQYLRLTSEMFQDVTNRCQIFFDNSIAKERVADEKQ